MNYKNFHSEIDIKYEIFKPSKQSNVLLVVFPGAKLSGGSSPAEFFNAIKAYDGANAIFFIDDYGTHTTAPYIMKNGDNVVERSFVKLVNSTASKLDVKNIVAIGQSSGGCAALYYGLKNNWYVITSSPSNQWYLSLDKFERLKSDTILRDRMLHGFSYAYGSDFGVLKEDDIKKHNEMMSSVIYANDYSKKVFLLNGSFEPNAEDTKKIINILSEKKIDLEVFWRKYTSHPDGYVFLKDKFKKIVDFIKSNDVHEKKFEELEKKSNLPLSDQLCIFHVGALERVDQKKKYRRLLRIKIHNAYGKLVNLKFLRYDYEGVVILNLFFTTDYARVDCLEGKAKLGKIHFVTNWKSSDRRKWAEIWIEKTEETIFRGSFSVEYSNAFISFEDIDANEYVTDEHPARENFSKVMPSIMIDGNFQIPLIKDATTEYSGAMSSEDKRKLNELYSWFENKVLK